jgi:dTDP-4-dehydrorhamnose 3,5-epimerase
VNFRPLDIPGAFVLEALPHSDERGTFARAFCADELAAHGLDARVAQASISTNRRRGTLRGMHYTALPSTEAKLVRCVRGSAHDVLLDLRPGSPALRQWVAVPLSRDGGRAVYVPPGVAHGFLTLEDETDILYMMTAPFDPSLARTVRYDDPAFAIRWPFAPVVLSERDHTCPDFLV